MLPSEEAQFRIISVGSKPLYKRHTKQFISLEMKHPGLEGRGGMEDGTRFV